MYVVVQGRIEVSVVSAAGRKISLNLISAGNCFGEVGMIDNQDRTASAVALEPTSLQPIGRSTFFAAARVCPDLAITITEILCERVRWLSDSVEDYALLSLDRRLARRLLLLHDDSVPTVQLRSRKATWPISLERLASQQIRYLCTGRAYGLNLY